LTAILSSTISIGPEDSSATGSDETFDDEQLRQCAKTERPGHPLVRYDGVQIVSHRLGLLTAITLTYSYSWHMFAQMCHMP